MNYEDWSDEDWKKHFESEPKYVVSTKLHGWVCPLCSTVHSPHISVCLCNKGYCIKDNTA